MKTRVLMLRYTFAAIAVVMASGICASASVVQVTGAGPGEGLTLNPSTVVYAIYAGYVSNDYSNTPYTVQGVTFQSDHTEFTYFNGFPAVGGYGGTVGTLDDVLSDSPGGDSVANSAFTDTTNSDNSSLISIMNGGMFYNSTTALSATINDLTPNTSYTINFLFSAGGSPARTETVAFNGGTTSDTITMSASDLIYATSDTVSSTSGGIITVQFGKTSGADPLLNAVIVSTPEPSCPAILGIISVWALSTRRPRRPRACAPRAE